MGSLADFDISAYKTDAFVETGTYQGASVIEAMKAGFKDIYSVELSPKLHEIARGNIQAHLNVAPGAGVLLYCGESVAALPQICEKLRGKRTTFWLDAHIHWFEDGTVSGGAKTCPLLEELDVIGAAMRGSVLPVILIDDVRCIRNKADWNGHDVTVDSVFQKILSIDPGYSFSFLNGYVASDVIAAVPPDYNRPLQNLANGREETSAPLRGPVYAIPESMTRGYTMNGAVPIQTLFFHGETGDGEIVWRKEDYLKCLETARVGIDQEQPFRYDSDPHLIRLLKRHPVQGWSVLIIGSEDPYYEAMAEQFGGAPTTVEYRKIRHNIEGLETFTIEEFEVSHRLYDCAISVSSIEHSGLGRYGDPLDPDADFKAMNVYRRRIKPGGFLYLQVPVGSDLVVWNAHRIYGRARLPRLLEGWDIVDSEGYSEDLFRKPLGEADQQPAFLLRNGAGA
jgi:hypothetical protein